MVNLAGETLEEEMLDESAFPVSASFWGKLTQLPGEKVKKEAEEEMLDFSGGQEETQDGLGLQ